MAEERTDPVVTVTGSLVDQRLDDEQAESWLGGDIRHSRGLRERQVVEWSDPRLPAIKNTVFNVDDLQHSTRVECRITIRSTGSLCRRVRSA